MNSGFTSNYFKPSRGVRQGWCVSLLLFVLSVELLAIMIRRNDDIKGVRIRQVECKISQFAGDTTCFVSSRESLRSVLDSIHQFGQYSGLTINPEKSVILPIGQLSSIAPDDEDLPLKQVEKVKILGIWFSAKRSIQQHWEWNFLPQINKMRATCSTWSNKCCH